MPPIKSWAEFFNGRGTCPQGGVLFHKNKKNILQMNKTVSL